MLRFRPPVMPRPSLDGLRDIGEGLLSLGELPDQLLWMYLTGSNPRSLADLQETLPGLGAMHARVPKEDPVIQALLRSGRDDLNPMFPEWSGVRVPRQPVPIRDKFGTPLEHFRRPPSLDQVVEPGHQFISTVRAIQTDPRTPQVKERGRAAHDRWIDLHVKQSRKSMEGAIQTAHAVRRSDHVRGIQGPRQRAVDEKSAMARDWRHHWPQQRKRPGGSDDPDVPWMAVTPSERRRRGKEKYLPVNLRRRSGV